jgi:hypothetical protein
MTHNLSLASSLRHKIRLWLVVEKLRDVIPKHQFEVADGAVALFGDDDFGDPLFLGLFVVDLVAVDEGHEVGVLFDGAGFAEVGELGAVVAGVLFGAARELGLVPRFLGSSREHANAH